MASPCVLEVAAGARHRVHDLAGGCFIAGAAADCLFMVEAISRRAVDAVLYLRTGPVLLVTRVWHAIALDTAGAALRATRVRRESVPAPRR